VTRAKSAIKVGDGQNYAFGAGEKGGSQIEGLPAEFAAAGGPGRGLLCHAAGDP
jgi:hypothetical protein